MQPILKVTGLRKSFPGSFWEKPKQVLHDLSFNVYPNRATGFVGNNGSGKTTSLKCILQFIRIGQGNIEFFGSELNLAAKSRIGYLPERPYLYEFMTCLEFLLFHWKLCGHAGGEKFVARADEVLKQVDLLESKNKRLRQFSKGMLQRAGLAQAILNHPEFLILDEPMSGLDPDGRILVKEILARELQRGASIFFSSHLLQDMEELCEDLVVINNGRILYNGPLKSFVSEEASLEKAFKKVKGQNPEREE